MRSIPLLLFFLLACIKIASAQSPETDSISKAEILKLGFLIGNWEGSGWMMGQNGKSDFNQTEVIQYKLDSTVILIEGKGTVQGRIIHNAMALVTYDKKENRFAFRSYLQNGQQGEFKAELIANKFYWYPNENVRYIIWLNEEGQWDEKGEYKNGGNWTQFFEMTLNRTD